jgi:hypothetical protein
MQPVEHFQGVGVDLAARKRVFRARDDDGFVHSNANCNNAGRRARSFSEIPAGADARRNLR